MTEQILISLHTALKGIVNKQHLKMLFERTPQNTELAVSHYSCVWHQLWDCFRLYIYYVWETSICQSRL